ncbi:hypothetical protein PG994_014517 [Apiospora phragmitis]|uniref:Uncharacterized protein n=1 Tax=Apiospora phragmitis TaxID=2905665 RepID=A0ABR1T6B2_9PEZI
MEANTPLLNLPSAVNNMDNSKHLRRLEQPMVALRRHVSLKFCLHLTGHIASALITGAILQLSLRSVYRADDGAWDYRWYMLNLGQKEEGNLLQILAKLHELIMVASLYGIALHISRRLLVGSAGVPFGLLVGGYQSPGSYIVHKALWSPLLGSFRLRKWRFAIFALGLLFATVFANALGPASAIALIPNLDWYTMGDPFRNIRAQTSTYHIGRENMTAEETIRTFYPTVLDRFTFDNEYNFNLCRSANWNVIDCPGADWEAIFSWANSFTGTGVNTNKVLRLAGQTRYITANAFTATTLLPNANTSGVAVGTSLPFFVVDLMDQLWSLVSLKGMRAAEPERQRLRISPESPVLAPVAKGLRIRQGQQRNAIFPYVLAQRAYHISSWPIPQNIWNVDRKLFDMRYTWVPVPQDDRRLHKRASIGIVFKLPGMYHGVVMPCTISSYWRRPEVTMDPTMNLRVENSFIETTALKRLGRPGSPQSVVRIEPE